MDTRLFRPRHPSQRSQLRPWTLVQGLEYVRILHLAASTIEAEVETALERALAAGTTFGSATIRSLVRTPTIPPVTIGEPSSATYDQLLQV